MKSRFFFIVTGLLSVFGSIGLVLFSYSSAQVPQMINYQGKLTNPSGAPVNDTLQMVFTIYNAEVGGTSLWTETQTAVIVEKGVFNVLLGSVNPIPDSVFDGSVRYLGVAVGGDPEITPRKPMVSVPYAYTDGDWTKDGDNIYRLQGNVGIGTASPVQTDNSGLPIGLDVANGGIGLANNASLSFKHTAVTTTKYPVVQVGSDNTLHMGDVGNVFGGVRFHAGGGERMRLTSTGNLGIGTLNPAGKLDVNGSILRKGQAFSATGSVNHNGTVEVPWGTTSDWNVFVSPRDMGTEEPGSEHDNALLKIECYATITSDTTWVITTRYKYKFSSTDQGQWFGGTANYILVPK